MVTNEPLPARVSDEDRDAAVAIVASQIPKRGTVGMYVDLSIVNALVSHGWGPKPALTRERIAERLGERLGPAMALNDGLVLLLRECGIEVTDE